MQLVIGNRNYSSWSLRPWLGMKASGIPFEEIFVTLRQAETTATLLSYSPAGKVPILIDGDVTVWDSLAIAEYLAECFPEKELWPRDRTARAVARSVCAEMHSGFGTLRTVCFMDIRSRKQIVPDDALRRDIERIVGLWRDCLGRFGGEEGFLFDRFSWADAFFAPVVTRFRSYGIDVPDEAEAYMRRILQLPPMQAWAAAAAEEPWVHTQA